MLLGALPVLEAAGSRVVVSRCPPRGTPSPVLATRFQRRPVLFHPRLGRAALTGLPTSRDPFGGCCRTFLTSTGLSAASTSVTADDALFLSRLVQSYGHQAPHETIVDRVNEALRPGPCPMAESGCGRNETVADPLSASLDTTSEPAEPLPWMFRSALVAVRERDTRRLLTLLKHIAKLPRDELENGVAALPRTTFSEFLRALDPLAFGLRDDPTRGIPIGIGMWQILNMDQVVDEWGVRTLYSNLLRQMLILMRALQATGWKLNINDYTPLLRAAGLASDHVVATMLWNQILRDGIADWRHSSAYREYVRARLLVHPAYSGHDKKRLMVTPRNMHKMGNVYFDPEQIIPQLDALRLRARLRSFKFGLNKNAEFVNDLSNAMRWERPARNFFYYLVRNGYRLDEEFLCIFIIGFARAGCLNFIEVRILQDYFGIYVKKSDGEIHAGPLDNISRISHEFYRPRTPTMRPNERLIEAVVEAYCCNGKISTALVTIDYISTRYKIPISSKIWCEILEWAYLLGSPPHSVSWHIPGIKDRVPGHKGVEMIWNVMTSPPYNVQPGFRQYDLMIRSLISRRQWAEVIEHMRKARTLYDSHCQAYEDAALKVYRARRDNVNCAKVTRSFQRAHFLKEYMWLRMNGWCDWISRQGFRSKKERSEQIFPNSVTARTFPDFVKEWREFVSNPVRYTTPTGYVQLKDPSEPLIRRQLLRRVTLNIPRNGARLIFPEERKQYRFNSKHSVGSLTKRSVDPLALLRGEHHTQRHRWKLRYRKDRKDRKDRTPPAAKGPKQEPSLSQDGSSTADDWEDDDEW